MKKESEKILYELAAFAAVLKEDDAKYIKERIAQIIRCEGNDSKVGKFDLYEFAEKEKKNGADTALVGIYCEDGLKVATNGMALIAIKADYPKEHEAKVIKRDGEFVEKRYPNWKCVLPDTTGYQTVPIPDKKKFTDWLSKCRAEEKVENGGKGKKYGDWYVMLAPKCYIRAELMTLLFKAADALDATEMAVTNDRAYIETENGKALFCLAVYSFVEDEKNIVKVLK